MMSVERLIAAEISKTGGIALSKLGLRFDKVAIRLLTEIRSVIEQVVPEGRAVILTVSAPVKHPAKNGTVIDRTDQISSAEGEGTEPVIMVFDGSCDDSPLRRCIK